VSWLLRDRTLDGRHTGASAGLVLSWDQVALDTRRGKVFLTGRLRCDLLV